MMTMFLKLRIIYSLGVREQKEAELLDIDKIATVWKLQGPASFFPPG